MRSCLLVVIVGLVWTAQAPAQQLTRTQKETTLSWLYTLQKDNGSFGADPEKAGSLPATNSGLRAIRYFGGTAKNKEGCQKFLASCWNKVDAGFAPMPGGAADVTATALGLMAAHELGVRDAPYEVKGVIYLCGNAKTFEQVRLAAAAYETMGAKCELAADWVVMVQKMRNADGTYGNGVSEARQTASAVVTVLRLGGKLDDPAPVVKALKAGQHKDGGWSTDGKTSDLETSYRVMRAFVMLKQTPDTQACREFVARCRHDNGSYGVRPGEPGTVSGTYFAGIILHWLDEMKK